jgi:hypothetical protein
LAHTPLASRLTSDHRHVCDHRLEPRIDGRRRDCMAAAEVRAPDADPRTIDAGLTLHEGDRSTDVGDLRVGHQPLPPQPDLRGVL